MPVYIIGLGELIVWLLALGLPAVQPELEG